MADTTLTPQRVSEAYAALASGDMTRIDTAIEVDYYKHGGILPYVLRDLLAAA